MTEEKRTAAPLHEGPLNQTPGHGTEDDNAGGDEPVPGGVQNTGGEND